MFLFEVDRSRMMILEPERTNWLWRYMRPFEIVNAMFISCYSLLPLVGTRRFDLDRQGCNAEGMRMAAVHRRTRMEGLSSKHVSGYMQRPVVEHGVMMAKEQE